MIIDQYYTAPNLEAKWSVITMLPLNEHTSLKIETFSYKQVIGAMIYLANYTRSDNCFSVHYFACFKQFRLRHIGHWYYESFPIFFVLRIIALSFSDKRCSILSIGISYSTVNFMEKKHTMKKVKFTVYLLIRKIKFIALPKSIHRLKSQICIVGKIRILSIQREKRS